MCARAGNPSRSCGLGERAQCSSSCTGLPVRASAGVPSSRAAAGLAKVTLPWRSTPQMPSATESSRISCWRVKLLGAPAFLGARQHLTQRDGRRLHCGHRLAVFAQAEMAIELEHRQQLAAGAHRHRPAGNHLLRPGRLPRAGLAPTGPGRQPTPGAHPSMPARAIHCRPPASAPCSLG